METQKSDYEIALSIVNKTMDRFEWFTEEQLVEKIISSGGILQVAPGTTLRDYLDNLVVNNFLFTKILGNSFIFIGNPEKMHKKRATNLLKSKGINTDFELKLFLGEVFTSQKVFC